MSDAVEEKTFQLKINGQMQQISSAETLLDWLKSNGLDQKRIAIEMNGLIVSKSRWAETYLKPEDQVEVIRAVGGG